MSLFCTSKMKKKEQLDLVYSDFLDMRTGVFLLYKPDNIVLWFDKNGYFFGIYDQNTLFEKMLSSFWACRYTFDDEIIQARKLIKKFKKSLPVLNYSSLLSVAKIESPIQHHGTLLATKKLKKPIIKK